MADDPKWKAALLGSNLPLEFEAARLLAAKGFRVDADFKYARSDVATAEEAAVGVRARAFTALSEPDQVAAEFYVLLECSQRPADVHWLFLPDVNPPRGPAADSRPAMRVVEEFSSYRIDCRAVAAVDARLPRCSKGLEIDPASGTVEPSVPGRGLSRLRHALPRLLVEAILAGLDERYDQNLPLLFCPILLTTARLLVARPEMTVEHVRRASAPQDVAAEVPYLCVDSDYEPDFQIRCEREFGGLRRLEGHDGLMLIEHRRAAHCRRPWELPFAILESLASAERYWLERLFTRFVVCDQAALPELIDALGAAAASAARSRRELH